MHFRVPSVSTRFFLALFVLLIALGSVVGVGMHGMRDVQRANSQLYVDNLLTEQATAQLGSDLDRAQILALSIAASGRPAAIAGLRAQLEQVVLPRVSADVAHLVRLHADDPKGELAQIARIPRAWGAIAGQAKHSPPAPGQASAATRSSASSSLALAGAIERLSALVAARRPLELEAAAEAHTDAGETYDIDRVWLLIASAAALVAAAAMARAGVTLKRLLDRQRVEELYGESEGEYIDTLQATASEEEAQELLRRQLERSFDGTRALVLTRNNSADRLEPKTSLAEFEPLREQLVGATPRSCLAMRLGRAHVEGQEKSSLLGCEICGGLPGANTCEPLLVSGEVIGSVLINQPDGPSERDRQRIRDTVAQAAPVLGNLRNLAIAQMRAATDGLTGLPNHRAAQDTLKRMVAQASRTCSPLAALLVDLDHFKNINDIYGHDRGDEVLAAAGAAFRGVVRESDFVARYGGEEFLLLLPATDKLGAVRVAEAARNAVASISVPRLEQVITASVGVAILPEDAADPVSLFRAADRALYVAKNNGRNRVETAVQRAPLGAENANGSPRETSSHSRKAASAIPR
jgi:diguanylate cyclase (GGDEF)-like protein